MKLLHNNYGRQFKKQTTGSLSKFGEKFCDCKRVPNMRTRLANIIVQP